MSKTPRTHEQNAAAWQRFKARHPERAREIRRMSVKRWRATHLDQWRALRVASVKAWRLLHPRLARESATVQVRAWRAAHREQARATQSAAENRRRARKFANGGSHTEQQWRDKCELLGNVCIYCGEAKSLTRDHKIPLARGGTDDITNIVPACNSCNSSKRNRTAREFIAARMAA